MYSNNFLLVLLVLVTSLMAGVLIICNCLKLLRGRESVSVCQTMRGGGKRGRERVYLKVFAHKQDIKLNTIQKHRHRTDFMY